MIDRILLNGLLAVLVGVSAVGAAAAPPLGDVSTTSSPSTSALGQTDLSRARTTAWRTGLGKENVYAAVDSLRPLLGVYFYFGGADPKTNAERLRATAESFDFVQIEPRAEQVDRCEEAGLPWMSVDQPAIPLGRESPQWNSARKAILGRTREFARRSYLLGWNDGSEPHTSFETPNYTGHNAQIYDALGVAEPTRSEFLDWLAGQYADTSPAEDTNHDSITFNRDFGVQFDSWAAVARPENRRAEWFEHALTPFRCKLIRDCEAGRIKLFHEGDPAHKVTPRLLRSLADPRMSYDLTYLGLGDATGVTFYCGGGFNTHDPNDTGCRIEMRGARHEGTYRYGLSMTPPQRPRAGIAQAACRVLLPEEAPVLFRSSVRAEGGAEMRARVELVEDVQQPDAPGRTLSEVVAGAEFTPLEVDLTAYAGRQVWLRLVADPGRTPAGNGQHLHWLEPRIEAADRTRNELLDFYKELRAGYRLRTDAGGLEPLVWLGVRGSMYNPWYADHVMSLVAHQARLAGKRAVINEFHPGSGSPDALFPFAVYDSLIRLMRFRVASVAWFCDMYKGQFTNYSVGDAREHLARARHQIMLWNPYAGAPGWPRSKVACFMPSAFATPQQAKEAAAQLDTGGRLTWALGELGTDFYLLNDLDQARHYDRIVIFLAYADREAEQKLHAFLSDGAKGKRVLILTAVSRLWGPVGHRISKQIDASLSDVLPVSPAGTRLVSRPVTLLPGIRASMTVADSVSLNGRPGFEPIVADDGSPVGARSANVLCLAGFPETPPADAPARAPTDTAIRRLVQQWLDVKPGTIDAGAIRIVISDTTAAEPGIYCLENSSVLSLGSGLVGYEAVHQNPVNGRLCGPAIVRVWPASEPRIVDTDVCMPERVIEQKDALSAMLVVPESLRVSRPKTLTVYWPAGAPEITLDGAPCPAAPLAPGFYRVSGVNPGTRTLRIGRSSVHTEK